MAVYEFSSTLESTFYHDNFLLCSFNFVFFTGTDSSSDGGGETKDQGPGAESPGVRVTTRRRKYPMEAAVGS